MTGARPATGDAGARAAESDGRSFYSDEPWAALTGELDLVAGVGARPFDLEVAIIDTRIARTAAATHREAIALRIGSSVAALPVIGPKFVAIEGVDHTRRMHRCEGFCVERVHDLAGGAARIVTRRRRPARAAAELSGAGDGVIRAVPV